MHKRVAGPPPPVTLLGNGDSGIQVRGAREADMPQLIYLHRIALRALGGAHYTTTQVDSLLLHLSPTDYVPAQWPAYSVVQVRNTIVCGGGWSVARQVHKSGMTFSDAATCANKDVATVNALYTHPEWVRRGIGRTLLTAIEVDARTAGHSQIEVRALLPAVPMFLACGYAAYGACRLLLRDGVSLDLASMRKPLTSAIGNLAQ